LDRLREGALDARNFPANIGKQRVCPGRSPAWASRSNSHNGRVNASAPQQRPDWESCESQFVTLAIDFCLRRAFTGPPGTTDCGIDLPPHKRTAFAKSRTEVFVSGTFSYAEDSVFPPNVGLPTIVDQRSLLQRYTSCIESASRARNGYPRRR
jgi:hypothetical protein